jgi:hypothetical protein
MGRGWLPFGLLLGALVLSAGGAEALAGRGGEVRFGVKGELVREAEVLGGGRFVLRGRLEPRAEVTLPEAAGIGLVAVLSPKGGPICWGPGHVFADGYEGP